MSNVILSISFSVCTLFFTFPAVLVFDAQRENVLMDFQSYIFSTSKFHILSKHRNKSQNKRAVFAQLLEFIIYSKVELKH